MRNQQQGIIEMLKQKKTNSWTPVGPTRARASGTNRLTLKSLGRCRHRMLHDDYLDIDTFTWRLFKGTW